MDFDDFKEFLLMAAVAAVVVLGFFLTFKITGLMFNLPRDARQQTNHQLIQACTDKGGTVVLNNDQNYKNCEGVK